MPDLDRPPIARRAQELASSGDFEGFNALVQTLTREYGAVEVERLRRDAVVRHAITELCAAASAGKMQR